MLQDFLAIGQCAQTPIGVRSTKLLGLLIPGACLAHIGVNTAHAQPRQHDRVIGSAQRQRGGCIAGFGSALEDQPGGDEVTCCHELLALLDQHVDLA